MEKKIRLYKEEFFNNLFEMKKINYAKPKFKKRVDTQISCTDNFLNIYFTATASKFSRGYLSNQDIWNEIINETYLAIQKVELNQPFETLSEIEQNKIRKYIKKHVYYAIKDASNPNSKKTTLNIGGERKTVTLDLKPDSVDKELLGDGDSSTSLINLLAEENSVFYTNKKKSYQMNYFIHWFHENRERVLVKTQNKFLDDLLILKNIDKPTPEETKEVTGTDANKINTKLKAIYRRVLKAWNRESLENKKKAKYQKIINEFNLINGFFLLLNDEEVEESDKELNNYLKIHFSKLENTIFKNMPSEYSININQFIKGDTEALDRKILYQITNNLNDRLDILEKRLKTVKADKKIEATGSLTITDEPRNISKSDSNIYYLTAGGLQPREESF